MAVASHAVPRGGMLLSRDHLGRASARHRDYDQLRRFFYLFLFRDPAGMAETVVAANEMAFIDRLWADWSPGYPPGGHLAKVKESLRRPANLAAAIGYYRAFSAPGIPPTAQGGARHTAEQQAVGRQAPQPTIYLHGANDGCIAASLARRADPFLAPSSRTIIVDGAGHFPHLEKPAEVNDHILAWLSS